MPGTQSKLNGGEVLICDDHMHRKPSIGRYMYVKGTEIQEHIKLLQTRKAMIDNLSTSVMNDEMWRGIIICSIPPTSKWLPIIPSLYAMSSLADIISTLFAYGMIIRRDTTNKLSTSMNSPNTILVTKTSDRCTNLNCKVKKWSTHTTANCYWPGGGKEGQLPQNFGQRNCTNLAESSMPTPTSTQPEHFVLSAHIPDTPGHSGVLIDVMTNLDQSPMALISQGFQKFQNGKVPTFMDSWVSDTMFVFRDVFTEKKSITPCIGDSAKVENVNFEIVGEGNVVQCYQVDRKEREVTYTQALHTLSLNANLISIGALDRAGLITTFGNRKGVTTKVDGTVFLTSQNINGMYLLETLTSPGAVPLAMASLSQPTSLEQWHHHFAHCSLLTIQDMANNNLVDGLIISEMVVNGKCENFILGCQTHCPFDGVTKNNLVPSGACCFLSMGAISCAVSWREGLPDGDGRRQDLLQVWGLSTRQIRCHHHSSF